jgi:hypothetical protein
MAKKRAKYEVLVSHHVKEPLGVVHAQHPYFSVMLIVLGKQPGNQVPNPAKKALKPWLKVWLTLQGYNYISDMNWVEKPHPDLCKLVFELVKDQLTLPVYPAFYLFQYYYPRAYRGTTLILVMRKVS